MEGPFAKPKWPRPLIYQIAGLLLLPVVACVVVLEDWFSVYGLLRLRQNIVKYTLLQ